MVKFTSQDFASLVQQARHAGDFFAEMLVEEAESEDEPIRKVGTNEIGDMLDSQPLYLADDRTDVDWRAIPPVVRDAMKYICWRAFGEAMAARKTGGHAPEGYPRGGKARKGKRPRGTGLVAAARALKDIWR